MMIKPGITELSKCVDSRYTLVMMAAKRARMLGGHDSEESFEIDYEQEKEKPVSTAAKEIAEGKIGYVRSEAIARAEEWEAEKVAAIHSLANAENENSAEDAESMETEEDAAE